MRRESATERIGSSSTRRTVGAGGSLDGSSSPLDPFDPLDPAATAESAIAAARFATKAKHWTASSSGLFRPFWRIRSPTPAARGKGRILAERRTPGYGKAH